MFVDFVGQIHGLQPSIGLQCSSGKSSSGHPSSLPCGLPRAPLQPLAKPVPQSTGRSTERTVAQRQLALGVGGQ